MGFWKKAEAKTKRKVQDPERMVKQYNRLLLAREMLHSKLVGEAERLERKRSREPPHYVR